MGSRSEKRHFKLNEQHFQKKEFSQQDWVNKLNVETSKNYAKDLIPKIVA